MTHEVIRQKNIKALNENIQFKHLAKKCEKNVKLDVIKYNSMKCDQYARSSICFPTYSTE